MRVLVATFFGFAASFGLGLVMTACSPDCDCGPFPESPPEVSVPLEFADRYTDDGFAAISPLDFIEGTITTEGEFLTISYVSPEGEYAVTYEKLEEADN